MDQKVNDAVKDYYGKQLQSTADLKTDACCTVGSMPKYLKTIMAKIHPEVSAKYYGCGLVAPELLKGMRILDLGSGSGQDCFILSALVGEEGSVLGVDMTDEQLNVANEHIDYHTEIFSYGKANVSFKKGYIERLDELDLADESFDIIVSNCVINLSPDKVAVLKEAHRLLKPGGELYFSDVYADRRITKELVDDPLLYGECLSGALYWNDFLNLAKQCGFKDPRLVHDRPLAISNEEVEERIGHIKFFSAEYRLFKIDKLEPACEDYGQAVIYKGGIPQAEEVFELDAHHRIEKNKIFPVCGNTYMMLHESRFKPYFEFIGTFDTHYGIFEGCGSNIPFGENTSNSEGGMSCC